MDKSREIHHIKSPAETLYTVFVSLPVPNLITSSFTTRRECDGLEFAPIRAAVVAGHTSFMRRAAEKTFARNNQEGVVTNADVSRKV